MAELIFREDVPEWAAGHVMFADLQVYVPSVLAVVAETAGLDGYMDQTGGGCGALVFPLEDGVLVVTHGDVFTYAAGDWQTVIDGWTVCTYDLDGEGCWMPDPRAQVSTEELTTDSLRDAVRRALADN